MPLFSADSRNPKILLPKFTTGMTDIITFVVLFCVFPKIKQ